MKIIKLKQPRIRKPYSATQPHAFAYTGYLQLPKPQKANWPRLNTVLAARKSRRNFLNPLSFQQLAQIMWHSARLREKRRLDDGSVWQSRIPSSAGGCHPIHIVILRAPEFPKDVLVYDPEHNGFGVIDTIDIRLLRKSIKETDQCLQTKKGTVLWFLADVMKTGNKYLNPESLIWRDSGVLLATIELVAEALGLESCAIGIHETPALRHALALPPTIIGVGGCIVAGAGNTE